MDGKTPGDVALCLFAVDLQLPGSSPDGEALQRDSSSRDSSAVKGDESPSIRTRHSASQFESCVT